MKHTAPIILTATDTTVGLLCRNARRLDQVKRRPPGKPYIRVFPSLQAVNTFHRIPRSFRRTVRRSRRTTFVLPNGRSFRRIHDFRHLLLLERFAPLYSSSANLSGHPYDEDYARSVADIVVEPLGEPARPSSVILLGKKETIKRLR